MDVISESTGRVTSIAVSVGDNIGEGTVVVVTELMKMLVEHKAPQNGVVSKILVALGDEVQAGQKLAVVSHGSKASGPTESKSAGGYTDSLISEILDRRVAYSDRGRWSRIEKRHASGGRSARENIDDLLDKGSFSELGGHALAAQHGTHTRERLIDRSAADGVIVGTGAIDGVHVAVLIVDYTVMAGTQGHFHHKKVDRIVEIARRRKLPLVMYPEGGGGRPNDTDAHAISVAQLEVTSFHHLAALRGVVPVVAVVHGYCFAGSAAFAAVADVIIGTKTACLGMGGPAMIEGGGLGKFQADEVGPASVHARTGAFDIVVEDEAAATTLAKRMIHFLKCIKGEPVERTAELAPLLPRERRGVFDVSAIIDAIFDEGGFVELKCAYAPNLISGFARLNGKVIGVLANNCQNMGGAIDGDAADKAAHMLDLCQLHQIPVVSLIDTPGFMVGPQAEETGQVRPIGRFFIAGAKFTQPMLAVVMRRAYGLGAMAMAGGGLHASDLTLSWPGGEVGAMGLEGAVHLGMRDHLSAIEDKAEREAETGRLIDELYERGKALNAAMFFELDDVILPDETRSRLIVALDALS